MNKLIEKKVYLIPFKIPIIINTIFMATVTLAKGKGFLYIDAFKRIGFFLLKDVKLKLKYFNK